jgi:uncharacterized protein YjbJ (UPF0337 family)
MGALSRQQAGPHHGELQIMDKDRIEGTVKDVSGKVKEEWGDLTDDPKTEAEGRKDQAEADLQKTWGETKDKARDVVDDLGDKR